MTTETQKPDPFTKFIRPEDDFRPQWEHAMMEKYGGQNIVWHRGKVISADVDPLVAREKAIALGVTDEYDLKPLFICRPGNDCLPGG